MNTTTHTVRRRIAVIASAAIVFPAFAACGTEVEPPRQDISRPGVTQDTVPVPKRTSGNRFDFRDEYGKAEIPQHRTRPGGSGTRNRMDFRDHGW